MKFDKLLINGYRIKMAPNNQDNPEYEQDKTALLSKYNDF